jgi:hypothetical protein
LALTEETRNGKHESRRKATVCSALQRLFGLRTLEVETTALVGSNIFELFPMLGGITMTRNGATMQGGAIDFYHGSVLQVPPTATWKLLWSKRDDLG